MQEKNNEIDKKEGVGGSGMSITRMGRGKRAEWED